MIFLIDDAKQVAGGQHSLLELASSLQSQTTSFKVLVKNEVLAEFYSKKIHDSNVVVTSFPIIYTLINLNSVIHVNTWRSFIFVVLTYNFFTSKCCFRVRSAPPNSIRLILRILNFIWRGKYICNSFYIKELLSNIIAKNSDLLVIYNYHGIDNLNVSKPIGQKVILTCAARISRRKNQLFLLDVFEKLIQHTKNFEFRFYGDYSELSAEKDFNFKFKSKIENLITKYPDNISYNKSSSKDIVYTTDALLVPHFREPLGRTLLETKYLGREIFLLNEGGNPEVFDYDDTNAFFLNVHILDWVVALSKYIDDFDYSRSNKLELKKVCMGKFNYENTVLLESKLLQELS